MKKYVDGFFTWLRSAYSESDGTGSSTRIHMTEIILFTLGVGIAFAVGTYTHKFTMTEFCVFLAGAGAFILTTCGPLYGANQAGSVGTDIVNRLKNGNGTDSSNSGK